MRRGIKKQEGENLTDANIKKVIRLLSAEKPITKKEACSILNISYNTSRLSKVIEDYENDQQYRKTRKAQKRGRPADNAEIAEIVESYLVGESFTDIARRIFRSVAFVKNIVEKLGVPGRVAGDERYEMEYLPDECVSDSFAIGEVAWSAKYHTSCEIRAKLEDRYMDKYNTTCYRVWIREPTDSMQEFGGFNAYVPAYDLGKLEHLSEYGLNTGRI